MAEEKTKADKVKASTGKGAEVKKTKTVKQEKVSKTKKTATASSPKKDSGKKTKSKIPAPSYEARLKIKYRDEIAPALNKEFGFKSPMQVPRLEKIVVSAGVGEAVTNKKYLDSVVAEIEQITGQKVLRTKASKSVANFKIRTGMEIGVKVTLRGNRMYEFLDRFLNIALPRVKDFRGVNPKAFDGRGNYSLGIDEQIIFPEIDYDKIEQVRGLNVAMVTTSPNDEQAYSLLAQFGMPFRKE